MKAVFDAGTRIGTAADWPAVEALLRARGRSASAAHNAVITRGVDTGRAYHIITADSIERMLDSLRLARARDDAEDAA